MTEQQYIYFRRSIEVEWLFILSRDGQGHICGWCFWSSFCRWWRGRFCSSRGLSRECYRLAWDFWSRQKMWFLIIDRFDRWLFGFRWAYRIGWFVYRWGRRFCCHRWSVRGCWYLGFGWNRILVRRRVWLHWGGCFQFNRTWVFFSKIN